MLCFWILFQFGYTQDTRATGGFSLKAEFIFGSQNQQLKIGGYVFGAVNFGNFGVESGADASLYLFVKRNGVRMTGIG
ncbi:MAG: hypothetical protein Q8J97_02000, partial [Flavobacteriaceae bacterium]|nr:hypothetical protein [Flavobacteriaceae bacterium]